MSEYARDPEKQRAYAKKHIQEKLDEIKIRPPKGTKDVWRAAADAQGKSLQHFIIDAVEVALATQQKKQKKPEA